MNAIEIKQLEADLALLISQLEALSPKVEVDHEARIRAIEKRIWWLAGIATTAGAIGGNWLGSM